jgi:hypothetical protein
MTKVRVKFLSRVDSREWTRYFPDADGVWGNCHFIFQRDEARYDWLVVYDDIPAAPGQTRNTACEPLSCPPQNSILITTEPSSIKAYGKDFAGQFGHILTSQPAWALPHPQRHFQQAANHWFYGNGSQKWMAREEMLKGPTEADKAHTISTIYSSKRQWHTMHAQRFAFIQRMRELLPEMDVFGRGATPMDDKAEALAPYRYHLAVENHIAPHHITEKLTDAFLGRCLPFYAGAPNTTDYFPADSFVPIDIRDPEGAARTIHAAISADAWAQRLEAIDEARRRTLEEHHVFAVIARIIEQSASSTPAPAQARSTILSRHAWRKTHPIGALIHMGEKLYVRGRTLTQKLLFGQ